MPLTEEALALAREINRKMGPDTVVLGSDMAVPGRFTSGSVSLDVALGGGWPANQWSEVIGHESAGKTAMVLKTIAANQALDERYTTFWVAGERYDEQQAAALGVDNSRVLVSPTQEAERAMDMMLDALASMAYTCIVLDSWPALITEEERDKTTGEPTVATGARVMSRFVKKAGRAGKRDVRGSDPPFHGIIINQWRDKIGGFSPVGTPQDTNGGKAKNYFYHSRVEVKRVAYKTEKRPGYKEPVNVGQTIRFITIKNKSAAPQQRALVDYYFRGAPFSVPGFRRGEYDYAKELLEMGKLFRLVSGGTYLTYKGDKFHGKNAFMGRIREDVDFRHGLTEDVMEIARDPDLVDQITEEQYDAAVGDDDDFDSGS